MSDKVEIVPYDSGWRDRFRLLAADLRSVLGNAACRIDHIGSTAVIGLAAKPIIDIQVSVSDFEPLDAYRVPIEHAGYLFRADNTERTKRYFRESAGQRRTHIHVRRLGSWSEQFALLFRDYLRENVAEAHGYADLKYTLAEKYQDDRHGYTEAKGQFIWEAMHRADKWSQDVGWKPGSSDA